MINDGSFVENMLIIFGNMLTIDKKLIFTNTIFLQLLKDILNSPISKGEGTSLSTIIFWNLNIIIEGLASEELLAFADFIPLALLFLSDENMLKMKMKDRYQEELSHMLKFLLGLSNNDKLVELMVNCNLISYQIKMFRYVRLGTNDISEEEGKSVLVLSSPVVILNLKIMGNMFALNDDEFLAYIRLLSPELLYILDNLIRRYRLHIKEDKLVAIDLMWTLANIVGGPSVHADIIVFHTEMLPLIYKYYVKDEKILFQTLMFFENLLTIGSDRIIVELLKLGVIKLLCDSIKKDDSDIIKVCLKCIEFIRIFCNKMDEPHAILNEFDTHSLLPRLEQLAIHSNSEISSIARNMVEEMQQMIANLQLNR
jgi:hypothetical protein